MLAEVAPGSNVSCGHNDLTLKLLRLPRSKKQRQSGYFYSEVSSHGEFFKTDSPINPIKAIIPAKEQWTAMCILSKYSQTFVKQPQYQATTSPTQPKHFLKNLHSFTPALKRNTLKAEKCVFTSCRRSAIMIAFHAFILKCKQSIPV